MGNLKSKISSEEQQQQPVSERAAVWRRLKLWDVFKTFVGEIINTVSFGRLENIGKLPVLRTVPGLGSTPARENTPNNEPGTLDQDPPSEDQHPPENESSPNDEEVVEREVTQMPGSDSRGMSGLDENITEPEDTSEPEEPAKGSGDRVIEPAVEPDHCADESEGLMKPEDPVKKPNTVPGIEITPEQEDFTEADEANEESANKAGHGAVSETEEPDVQMDENPEEAVVDVAVTVIESMLEEALRSATTIEDLEDDEEPESQADISTKHPREDDIYRMDDNKPVTSKSKEQTVKPPAISKRKAKNKVPRAKRALTQRLQTDQSQQEQPADEPDDDQQAAVEVVRSSLDVALPVYTKRKKVNSKAPAVHPAFSYVRQEFSYDMVQQNQDESEDTASNHEDDSQAQDDSGAQNQSLPRPANIQDERTKKRREDLKWAKPLYANLRLDGKSIRLLELLPAESGPIHTKLITKPFEEVENAYEALSYTWGSPETKNKIRVNEIEVPVTDWLNAALDSLRLEGATRTLWVDALCINQTDLVEKSLEIPKMGDIYRLAKSVVIFHGAPSKTTAAGGYISAVFKFLSRLDGNNSPQEPLSISSSNGDDPFRNFDRQLVLNGFIDFLCRPWWRRVWTIQEFYLATEEPVWQWGITGVSNTALKRDVDLLMTASWDLYGGKNVQPWIHRQVENATGKPVTQFSAEVRRISEVILRRQSSHGCEIPSRFYRSLSAKAFDPRDLVYGLREIFDSVFRKVFVPDYQMPVELLYACLAVFLMQAEGWVDMLWWYPLGFDGKDLPGWLPDFRKRIVPDDLELLPRDNLLADGTHMKLLVLKHTIHAEGYYLDEVDFAEVIDKDDVYAVIRCLWDFDKLNRRANLSLTNTPTESERARALFNAFQELCRPLAREVWYAFTYSRRSVLAWTANWEGHELIPTDVIECLPYGENLLWHAFQDGPPPVFATNYNENDAGIGLLNGIFTSEATMIFRQNLAADFIGDCIFNWEAFQYALDALASTSPWSSPESRCWQVLTNPSHDQQVKHPRNRAQEIRSFLLKLEKHTSPANLGLVHLFELFALVLVDSGSYASFARTVIALRSAAARINSLANRYKADQAFNNADAVDLGLRKKVQRANAVATHYSERQLFVTRQGFHGMTAPGVKVKRGDTLLVLDGLSFPVLSRSFKEKDDRGRFAGCAIIRGIKTPEGKGSTPQVPEGFKLGEKRVFKLI